MKPRAVLAAGLMALAACAPRTVILTEPPAGYVEDAGRRVAAIDWSRAVPVTVRLTDYAFEPTTLVFRRGLPYRLHLDNTGRRAHTFVSEDFFKAIAVHSLTLDGRTVETPYLQVVEVQPGQSADIAFVAVRSGSWPLECTEPLHEILGMTGEIRVEPQ